MSRNPVGQHPLPPLRRCISALKNAALDLSTHEPRDKADLYVSALAFLCYLKADQATLHKARGNAANGTCLSPGDTPAIASMTRDLHLFRSVLALLRSKSSVDYDLAVATSVAGSSASSSSVAPKVNPSTQQGSRGSRKRSASAAVSENGPDTPHKLSKIHHSPVVVMSERKKATPVPNLRAQQLQSTSLDQPKGSAPELNVPVIAACIFYSALQHMDHWPTPLAEAYAEDCFGPRLWVDDERCQLLTANLGKLLENEATDEDLDASTLAEAERVANLYSKECRIVPGHSKQMHALSGDAIMKERSYSYDVESKNNDSSDSDSGDEECVVEVSSGAAHSSSLKTGPALSAQSKNRQEKNPNAKSNFDAESSSSGEDEGEEEVVIRDAGTGVQSQKSQPRDGIATSSPDSPETSLSIKTNCLPGGQMNLNLTPIRRRFVGSNRDRAHKIIADTLSARLDSKTKQNSRLLSTLPAFVSIPRVRALTACHLERWLQSPALSGLARSLFSSTVSHMQNVDPPLPDDIEAINKILSMKLKANQLTAHIDNVTNIAKIIPTVAVSRHIFLHFLNEEVTALGDNISTVSADHMRMFMAVYSALPPSLAAEAVASAVLILAADRNKANKNSLPALLRRIAVVLGPSYDGYLLVKAFLRRGDSEPDKKSSCSDEDKARFVFECMTLIAPPPSNDETSSHAYNRNPSKNQRKGGLDGTMARSSSDVLPTEVAKNLSRVLLLTRKEVMKWCCSIYAASSKDTLRLGGAETEPPQERPKSKGSNRKTAYAPVGAGTPVYSSILDGESQPEYFVDGRMSKLATMRCLLFLASPESPELFSFLSASADSIPYEQSYRIRLCSEFGCDLDDEMMWIILKSAALPDSGINSSMALSLIEHLFESCKEGRTPRLILTDSELVWEMYNLVLYKPVIPEAESDSDNSAPGENNPDFGNDDNRIEAMDSGEILQRQLAAAALNMYSEGIEKPPAQAPPPLPRLAYPGMWWRVTALAHVMCGESPVTIGDKMWKEHPTLQALTKMTTSGRYRFPTADCDEEMREAMKSAEAGLRDKESKIAERLFLPEAATPKKAKKAVPEKPTSLYGGSRISARQREKQAKLLHIQREKEAAVALADAQRRKKRLRMAQKSIMLWDPRCAARKPPKESVNLILSVDAMFGLSETFQQSTEPDFLLRTLGSTGSLQTSRGSIERAYDWLIPIISSHPTIINRLPPSASCFLLLRAYGTDGDGNNQLLKLSTPLLCHVSDCLTGTFGEADALRASDLLLVDVTDQNSDRRRCARRVLQEALGKNSETDTSLETCNCSWLSSLLQIKHAVAIIPKAIHYISNALAYERGRVLRAYVLALHSYIKFAEEKGVEGSWNFVATLCELLSVRPHICSAAMDRFFDFRDLALSVICAEFETVLSNESNKGNEEPASAVKIVSWRSSPEAKHGVAKSEAIVPLTLLRAALVLISNWQGQGDTVPGSDSDENRQQLDTSNAAESLIELLLKTPDHSEVEDAEGRAAVVACATGAKFLHSGKRAVSVDQWVMLAKSRCDLVATNAALSAPEAFLPRLLLCSGLPRSCLLTMVDRLGKLGDAAVDHSRCYGQLFLPSATAEWGIGHIRSRRLIARKLLGRLSAYLNQGQTSPDGEAYSSVFLVWLSNECHSHDKSRKRKLGSGHVHGRVKASVPKQLKSHSAASSILSSFVDAAENSGEPDKMNGFSYNSLEKPLRSTQTSEVHHPHHVQSEVPKLSKEYIELRCKERNFVALEEQLETLPLKHGIFGSGSYPAGHSDSLNPTDVARHLLQVYLSGAATTEGFTPIILKWVPLLTRMGIDSALFEVLFSAQWKIHHHLSFSLVGRCAAIWLQELSQSCQVWILSQSRTDGCARSFFLNLMLRFLIITSGQHSVQITAFASTPRITDFVCAKSPEDVLAAVTLAFKSAKSNPISSESELSRNLFPDWLLLILLVARCGKKHIDSVTSALLSHLPADGPGRKIIPATLLRLYAYFPSLMSLGNARVRGLLLDAASATEWLEWRSPLDEQVEEMIKSLINNPHQRFQQSITELAKRHPLIVARKFKGLADALEIDAAAARPQNLSERRGRVLGKSAYGVAIAKTKNGLIKVEVRHWGMYFTEPLWLAVVDILLSVPGEVLFSCGLHMGLKELMCLCLKLICVQQSIQNKEVTAKIRGKLGAVFTTFRNSNESALEAWLATKIAGIENWGTLRDVAARCEVDVGYRDKAKAA